MIAAILFCVFVLLTICIVAGIGAIIIRLMEKSWPK